MILVAAPLAAALLDAPAGGAHDVSAPLEAIRDVEGWLSPAQAEVLFGSAAALPDGALAVEIGSFQGRSTIMLARGLAGRGTVVAIDPHAGNDRGPREIEGMQPEAEADHERFKANLARAGVADAVTPRPPALAGGARRGGGRGRPALRGRRAPLRARPRRPRALGRARAPGRGDAGARLVLVGRGDARDAAVGGLRRRAFASRGAPGRWRATGAAPLGGSERARNAGRQLAQLPWFARNLGVKVAVVLRLRRRSDLALLISAGRARQAASPAHATAADRDPVRRQQVVGVARVEPAEVLGELDQVDRGDHQAQQQRPRSPPAPGRRSRATAPAPRAGRAPPRPARRRRSPAPRAAADADRQGGAERAPARQRSRRRRARRAPGTGAPGRRTRSRATSDEGGDRRDHVAHHHRAAGGEAERGARGSARPATRSRTRRRAPARRGRGRRRWPASRGCRTAASTSQAGPSSASRAPSTSPSS